MKTMIVLEAVANQGKTSTLTFLKEMFFQEGYTRKIYYEMPDDKDFAISFEINKKIVAIISQGDDHRLDKRLTDLYKENIDVLFCASRTKGSTIKAIENISKKHDINIIWSTTYRTKVKEDEIILNKLKACHLRDVMISLDLV